jgi:hypothetical protein
MGKETLKETFSWLNELGCNLSRGDLMDNLILSDISEEIRLILEQLKSKESKLLLVDNVPEMIGTDENDEDSLDIEDEII